MTCLAANNASARLATSVTVEDLAIQLSTGEGAMFPTPTADDYFMVTVFEQTGETFRMEIMKCTHRDGDVLTVERAQEGTSAVAFSVSGRVENRFTAGMYNAMGDEIRQIAMDVQRQLDGKQDTLTFDNRPTAGSSNPVTSDGIRSFVQQAVFSSWQLFTANGTFVVPDGVTMINVLIQGGGGGGGGNGEWPHGQGPGSGGASGGAAFLCMRVTSGEQYPVTVGSAGVPGVSGNASGGAGGTSSFGGSYATGGGGGGASTSAGAYFPGTAGTASVVGAIPALIFNGQSGAGNAGGRSVTQYGAGGNGSPGSRGSPGYAGQPGAVFVWW